MKKYLIIILFFAFFIDISYGEKIAVLPIVSNDNSTAYILRYKIAEIFQSQNNYQVLNINYTDAKIISIMNVKPSDLSSSQKLTFAKKAKLDGLVWGILNEKNGIYYFTLKVLDVLKKKIYTSYPFPINLDYVNGDYFINFYMDHKTYYNNTGKEKQNKESWKTKKLFKNFSMDFLGSSYYNNITGNSSLATMNSGTYYMGNFAINYNKNNKIISNLDFQITNDSLRSNSFYLKRFNLQYKFKNATITLGEHYQYLSSTVLSKATEGVALNSKLWNFNIYIFSGLSSRGYDGFEFPIYTSGLNIGRMIGKSLRIDFGSVYSSSVAWKIIDTTGITDKKFNFIGYSKFNFTLKQFLKTKFEFNYSNYHLNNDSSISGDFESLDVFLIFNKMNMRLLFNRYGTNFKTISGYANRDQQEIFWTTTINIFKKISGNLNIKYIFNSLSDKSNRDYEFTPWFSLTYSNSFDSYITLNFMYNNLNSIDGSIGSNRITPSLHWYTKLLSFYVDWQINDVWYNNKNNNSLNYNNIGSFFKIIQEFTLKTINFYFLPYINYNYLSYNGGSNTKSMRPGVLFKITYKTLTLTYDYSDEISKNSGATFSRQKINNSLSWNIFNNTSVSFNGNFEIYTDKNNKNNNYIQRNFTFNLGQRF